MLSILTLESADSIRFLYRHFLSKLTDKSLNAFYYACSYAKVDYSRFMNATASMALKLIPKSLERQPVFLCIDDTIVPKYGKKFEDVSKLFDHSAHNGSGYLNGHCFIGGYYIGMRRVLTNIFGTREVFAYVTATEKEGGSRRLFFSTVFPTQLQIFCAWQEKTPLNQTGSAWMDYIPLFLYSFRWKIEVSHYEQKTFWSLCSYMVRSRKGIEMLVNLINIAYCAMKLLPYQDEAFSKYRRKSVQDFRFVLSERIRQEVFFATFVKKSESIIKSSALMRALKYLVQQKERYL